MNATDPQSLYRQRVLDHSRQPHNFRRLENPDCEAVGHNPLCGDKMTIFVRVADDRLSEVTFEGSGCAISLASASMLTDIVAGSTRAQATQAIAGVMDMLGGHTDKPLPERCEPMEALSAVRDYPSRIRCATLAWRTLAAAIAGESAPVTTEQEG